MNNGFYVVATLDRFNELAKFLSSLRKHHSETIQVMIANNIQQAHEFKTLAGSITPFDNTVMMDIDMLVLQNFSEVFKYADRGQIAIYEEEGWGIFNSGFVAFNKKVGKELSKEWHKKFIEEGRFEKIGKKGLWDQDLLTILLKSIKWNKRVYKLPRFYNYCVSRRPPPPEEKEWDQIKVIHFWHRGGFQVDKNKRSWKLWNGEKIMVGKNPGLVAEIKRMREILAQHKNLNKKRVDLLDHLLEVHDIETGKIKPEKPKTFEQLETEKKEATKQEKKTKSKKKKVEKEEE